MPSKRTDDGPDLTSSPKPPQPLHPSIISRLDPEYITFHNKYFQYVTPSHTRPWDPSSRIPPPSGTFPSTETDPLEVGGIKDWKVGTRSGREGTKARVRVYTPKGEAPISGWPVVFFIPGGGWVYGGLDNQASFSTNMCVRAKCVVVSLDHRLAPEDPYPAALEDAIDALRWLVQNASDLLRVDTTRIAVAGCSSGGNIAAALVLTAPQLNLPIHIIFQLLLVPALDNTASTSTSWHINQHAPWLTPERMLWFRGMYLPNKSDWATWETSPILAPGELLRGVPETWIAIGGADILMEEGRKYGDRLKGEGVQVEVRLYEGGPHAVAVMDGDVMHLGRRLVTDAVDALSQAFSTV
ncbi:Alpha/Beta hydrolase protein [Collybia nuda]|uniref:Alpha/Beta hydrolase protein n=1 Tax=Collybia nuda TaxID=64659 RepID=A0A9P5Y6R7_9AGAR|nr:Alpha/Beta hydrolase protein [Collybia nuda]